MSAVSVLIKLTGVQFQFDKGESVLSGYIHKYFDCVITLQLAYS